MWYKEESKLFHDKLDCIAWELKSGPTDPSFMKYLLENQNTHKLLSEEMAYLTGLLFGAGSDNTAVVVMAVACHPEVQSIVLEELDNVIRHHRGFAHCTMSDIPYVEGAIVFGNHCPPVSALGAASVLANTLPTNLINAALFMWSFHIVQDPDSPIDDKGLIDGVIAHLVVMCKAIHLNIGLEPFIYGLRKMQLEDTGKYNFIYSSGMVATGQETKAGASCVAHKIRCEFMPGATAPSDSDVGIQQQYSQRRPPKSQVDNLSQPKNMHGYCPIDLEAVIEDDLSNSTSIKQVDGMDSQGEEIFDISGVSLGDSDHSEDEDDITPLASHWHNPRSRSQPVKSLKTKSVPQLSEMPYHDHNTCMFDIECVVCQQDYLT
ncbi:hypothetical protein BS17DRAFT_763339 [Gyrodon lividus]|nr:hypothetical protein BS17DRAFT_763339 [Gyrodon lividus]